MPTPGLELAYLAFVSTIVCYRWLPAITDERTICCLHLHFAVQPSHTSQSRY